MEPLDEIPLRRRVGPNGPAIFTSLDDISAIKNDKVVKDAIFWILELRPKVQDYYIKILFERKGDGLGKYHRRTTFLSDKAGKTRLIAIGDY